MGNQAWSIIRMSYSISRLGVQEPYTKNCNSLQLRQVNKVAPQEHEVLVEIKAVALNHRDLFIRRHQYPSISLENPMFSDGYGTVVELGSKVSKTDLLQKNVLLTPMRGWVSDAAGPEDVSAWTITGSTRLCPTGTAQDYICVHKDEVVVAPPHLSAIEGAALPLVGLTAWRAINTKTDAKPGQNILVTGIGGGVALTLLQFGIAMGVNVYVTSGDQNKIDKAAQMGAKGGAIYKNEKWEADIRAQLPQDRPFLDAIIDGAGGDIVTKAVKLLKPGGIITQYGMTASPQMNWNMSAVLHNIELKGTTMGSRKEFREMVDFVTEKQIRPVVSRVVRGLGDLEGIDSLFSEMEAGEQMGKLVVEIDDEGLSHM